MQIVYYRLKAEAFTASQVIHQLLLSSEAVHMPIGEQEIVDITLMDPSGLDKEVKPSAAS